MDIKRRFPYGVMQVWLLELQKANIIAHGIVAYNTLEHKEGGNTQQDVHNNIPENANHKSKVMKFFRQQNASANL